MSLFAEINKRFCGFRLDISLSSGNETIGLLGSSGSGKSLTLKCIAGLVTPDSGKIVVNNITYFDKASNKKANIDLSPQVRKTSLLFQNYMLFPNMTVSQNISAGISKNISKSEKEIIVNKQLKRFNLEDQISKFPGQLSGGQQQRVALARMLAATPNILMLDEPFSALDSHLKGALEQHLSCLFGEYEGSVLYVSHDIDEALRLCDKIAVIDNGSIAEICSGQKLVESPSSSAGIKLSGCKNLQQAKYIDDHTIYLEQWRVYISLKCEVPHNVKYFGVRAFHLRQVFEKGKNVFKMRVEHTTDSRFDRSVILSFENEEHLDNQNRNMNDYIDEEYMYWRIDKLNNKNPLPNSGDIVYIQIPDDDIFLTDK